MIEINLKWPTSSLWPNRSNGTHWATRQEAKKSSKDEAYYLILETRAFMYFDTTHDYTVEITAYPPNRIKRDADGLLSALKPSLDGIAAALQIDDRHFNPITIFRSEQIVRGGKIIVRIV